MRDPQAAAIVITGEDVREILADPSKLTLVAQPIIDGSRAVVTGYETLARFQLGKVAPPDRVFAAAAAAGISDELEALVVHRALELSKTKPPNCFLTINIDPLNFLSPRLLAELDAFGSFAGVVFELTEQHSIDDLRAVRRQLDRLKSRGAMIALDDAGAGYSGLKQILELQPQLLKIDRGLVTGVHQNEAKRALIQMLGDLAGRLDAWLLAEGIEDEDECTALFQLGVPLYQGYFFGRPTAPWAPIDPRAQELLQRLRRSPLAPRHTVDPLVERSVLVGPEDAWPEIARVAVRIDATRRPIEMRIVGEDGTRVRAGSELLRIKRDARSTDVALRAATRHERLRWDPLVVVDDNGGIEGLVGMHRLVYALASDRKDRKSESNLPVAAVADDVEPIRH